MSDFQKWQEKKVDKKREKKKEAKLNEKDKKLQGSMTEKELIAHNKAKAQLELLIGDQKTSAKDGITKEAQDLDDRFKTKDYAFAVDPTHKEYAKVVLGGNKTVKRQSHHQKRHKK